MFHASFESEAEAEVRTFDRSRMVGRAQKLTHYFNQKSIKLPQNGHINGSCRAKIALENF